MNTTTWVKEKTTTKAGNGLIRFYVVVTERNQPFNIKRPHGLVALKDGKMILLKVPYPTGFYAKGLDDPKTGWKGRGLWASSGDCVPWLQEGGKGMMPMAVHFQIWPDPLAH
jgi:hypothetical protein